MCRFRHCFRAKTSERPLRSIRMCETIFMSYLSTKNTDIITRHGVYFTTVTDPHKAQKQRLKYIRSFFFRWLYVNLGSRGKAISRVAWSSFKHIFDLLQLRHKGACGLTRSDLFTMQASLSFFMKNSR